MYSVCHKASSSTPVYCIIIEISVGYIDLILSIRIVIYFHSQVVDGQRKIINLLQEQIENVRHHLHTDSFLSLCHCKDYDKAG